jgi:hypothetical protein
VTSTRAVFFRRFVRHFSIDVEIDKAIEYYLRAFVESDFDERVLTWLTGNNGMNAAACTDPTPVHVGEVCRFRLRRPHGDGAADQDAGSCFHRFSPINQAFSTGHT